MENVQGVSKIQSSEPKGRFNKEKTNFIISTGLKNGKKQSPFSELLAKEVAKTK